MNLKTHPLHERGLIASADYLKNERELVSLLQEMGKKDLFRRFGFSGPYRYAIDAWKLSEASAELLVTVAKLCLRSPEVNRAVQDGKITLSKARRIAAPIAKGEDAATWVQTAMALPQKQLEKEVVRHCPEVAIQERIKPVFGDRSEFRCGIDSELEGMIQKVREIASRSLRKPASLEETLRYMAELVLKHKDPIQRAERAMAREAKNQKARIQEPSKKIASSSESSGLSRVNLSEGRRPISARAKHLLALRDHGECQEIVGGEKCLSRFYTDAHHIVPVACGGSDALNNLITLCKFHHELRHGFEGKNFAKPKISEGFAPFERALPIFSSGLLQMTS